MGVLYTRGVYTMGLMAWCGSESRVGCVDGGAGASERAVCMEVLGGPGNAWAVGTVGLWGLRAGPGPEPGVGFVAGGASRRQGRAGGLQPASEPRVGCVRSGAQGCHHPAPPHSTQHRVRGSLRREARGKSPLLPPGHPVQLVPGLQPPPACKSFAFTIPPLAHYHTNFICLGLLAAIKLARFPGLACLPRRQGVRRRRLGTCCPGPPQTGR